MLKSQECNKPTFSLNISLWDLTVECVATQKDQGKAWPSLLLSVFQVNRKSSDNTSVKF